MTFKIKHLAILLVSFSLMSCNDDDKSEEIEEPSAFAGCCSLDPVFGANVNNLVGLQEQIIVDNLFTPNGDGINDLLSIDNIESYENHTVTIYSNDEEVIFESTNYGETIDDFFPVGFQGEGGIVGISDGTYKYKVVVENEQTFLKSGTFCLFTNNPVIEQNFSECDPLADGGFDPIISGQ